MDFSRFFVILCAFLLLICLTFAITALVALRNVVSENQALQAETVRLIEQMKQNENDQDESISVSAKPNETTDTVQSQTRYCLKSICGVLGIYTEQGEPVRMLDTEVSLLPSADRMHLEAGIFVDTWKDMLELIQDYTE